MESSSSSINLSKNPSYQSLPFNSERWMKEIDNQVQKTTMEMDKKAMLCFQKAMHPLLMNPETLRNLIGKMAATYAD